MRGSPSQSEYRASSSHVTYSGSNLTADRLRWHLSISLLPPLTYLTAARHPDFPVALATAVVVTDVRE